MILDILDDRSISKPPYTGPNTEPLPVRLLSAEDILALLNSEYPDEVNYPTASGEAFP